VFLDQDTSKIFYKKSMSKAFFKETDKKNNAQCRFSLDSFGFITTFGVSRFSFLSGGGSGFKIKNTATRNCFYKISRPFGFWAPRPR
jgi:hypothetical protein